jgi:hypothetical protein
MAEESAREDGTRGRGLDDDRDIVCSPCHFLPASLLWVKKCSGSACQSVLVIVILPPVLVNHSGSWYPEHSIVAASTFGS